MTNVADNIEYFGEVDEVEMLMGVHMYFWEYFCLYVWSSLESGIDYKVLDGDCIDRRCLFDIAVIICPHHVIKNGIHILPKQILVIVL